MRNADHDKEAAKSIIPSLPPSLPPSLSVLPTLLLLLLLGAPSSPLAPLLDGLNVDRGQRDVHLKEGEGEGGQVLGEGGREGGREGAM